ncbi:hypothetical protein NQ176_g10786 [Zarea fungicola]|uniref:Uncharacterized protein n=1 Tax=Zarea fungicola TaxID=93591 RepID=A0ACC1MDJ2_9HYPO|nr:hypothetical protein NQ176_g10786 [Lecanicillium fungicola]
MARSSGESPALPVVEKQPAPGAASAIHPSLFILNWIIFSNATILFNKWLLDTAGFSTSLRCRLLGTICDNLG